MAEWAIDFRIPTEFAGDGFILITGYTPAEEGEEEPTAAQVASALADAQANFKQTEYDSMRYPQQWSDWTVDTVKPDWSKAEKVD